MPKLLKCCKAQFFIISAALVITSISLAAFYLQSLFLPTVTSVSLKTEPEYIGQIKNVLFNFYKSNRDFDNQTFFAHLKELEESLTYYLAQQGILFSLKYQITSPSQGGATSWWIPPWKYRRAIFINNTANSNALHDYQILVTLDTASLISQGKLQSDCDDIRFVDSDDQTELNYWIESGCGTANTKIWVKVPEIPASSVKKIYVYYGNPSANGKSNGTKVFEFFEDFNDADTEWSYSGSGHGYSLNSSNAHSPPESAYLYNIGGCDEGYLYITIPLPDTNSNLILEFWDRVSVHWWNEPIGIKFNDTWIWCYDGIAYSHPECDRPAHDWAKQIINISLYKGKTVIFKIYHKDTTWACGNLDHYADINVDDIRIRKYTTPEPIISVSSEEETHDVGIEKIMFWYNLTSFGFKSQSYVECALRFWWNPAWKYRRAIFINNTANSNALHDYQILVTLDTASLISQGKLQSDCDDIRFVDSDDQTELNYWIESGCGTANTKIWVKVPEIPASSVKKIYVYYGNPSANGKSNGDEVFEFFEDFEDLASDWNINNNYGNGNGLWHVTSVAEAVYNGLYALYFGSDATLTYDTTWKTREGVADTPSFTLLNGYGYKLLFYSKWEVENFNGEYDIMEILVNGINRVWRKDSNTDHTSNGEWLLQVVDLSTYAGNTIFLRFHFNTVDGIGNNYFGWAIDSIFLRKYTTPEPIISVSSEEETGATQ